MPEAFEFVSCCQEPGPTLSEGTGIVSVQVKRFERFQLEKSFWQRG
jgi:hypothetical protein